jgi:hypothetical protein
VLRIPLGHHDLRRADGQLRLRLQVEVAEPVGERPREAIGLALERRDPDRREALGFAQRLDEAELDAGHVVEAGHELRRDGGAALDEADRALEEIGRIDGAEGGDEALVLGPDADDEAGALAMAPRAAHAEAEGLQVDAAVAHVAVRALEHRRDAAALEDGGGGEVVRRRADRPDRRAHGQPALGVGGDARVVAGVVDDASGQLVEGLEPEPRRAGRHRVHELRRDPPSDGPRGHDHLLRPRPERLAGRSAAGKPRRHLAGDLSVRRKAKEGEGAGHEVIGIVRVWWLGAEDT